MFEFIFRLISMILMSFDHVIRIEDWPDCRQPCYSIEPISESLSAHLQVV